MVKNKTEKIKNVIILGAGASKSEGAPSQKELIKIFFENKKIHGPKLIKEFFNEFWGINDNNIKNSELPTFEECLGVLDLAYLRRECFKGWPKDKIIRCRTALVYSIAKTLNDIGKKGHHNDLVNKLMKKGILKETAFISLNYDILIDNALVRHEREANYNIDYGISLMNYKYNENNENNHRKPKEEKSVLLLKPHGSLNWMYCPTCNNMELTPKVKGAIKAIDKLKKCKKCKTNMEPVIIPPTFYKDMSNPFIQQIYLKADEVLRNAERIFICGYSFPDADMHIKYLLKRAEIFKGKTPKIYVVNEDNFNMDKIRRFFKNKENIINTKLSFKSFVKEGINICKW